MEVPLLVSDFLNRALHVYPDKLAVACGDDRESYRELGARVNRLANALAALGVGKGDRVAILSPNCHRFMESFFGVTAIGAVLVPLNYRLVPPDFVYIVNHGGVKVFLVDHELVPVVSQIAPELESVQHYVLLADKGEKPPADWLSYEEMLAAAPASPPPDPGLEENDLATLNYTSGTTARPKGVMMTHRNLYVNALNLVMHLGITDRDVLLHTLPMFHANGWGTPFAVTVMGGSHISMRRVDGRSILEQVEREGVTLACMAPAVLAMILNYSDAEKHSLRTTPRVIVAGAPPPAAFIKQLKDRLGWGFIQVYGLTETAPLLTVSQLKPHMDTMSEDEQIRYLDRAGVEMVGVNLRVVDENGVDVAHDDQQIGEVIARSNLVLKGYWRQPEETDKVIVDGWFHTGDLATMSTEGSINIVDRAKDVIITGGENVSSIEVEDALYQHPAVLECAVIGVPDEKWGETIKALIVLREGQRPGERAIIEHCRDRLAHFKCPTSVAFVEKLPRTATGKLQKFQLREPYWAGHDRRVN
jgi:fatty-acyl-CoA synthase